MATVRSVIKRDIGVKVEGVVKVFDRAALAAEVREFVVTDKVEAELKEIFDTFTHQSEVLRRGGMPRDVMGIWVSGFFGSGKSHFAKVLGYLLQNEELGDGSTDRCIDVFAKHLSDTPRGKDLRLRLGEVKLNTVVRTIAFEIKSRQSLTNPNSVGEILLSEFYRHIGLAENFVVARIERKLARKGLLDKLASEYEAATGVPWRSAEGRDDLLTVRRRLAEVLPKVDPVEYPTERAAKDGLRDMFTHEKITAEGIADELVAWVDAQPTPAGKTQHLVFVIDEMGSFIGDSADRIGEMNSLAEMIGNKGKGKVWLIVTSQQDLERVVDRTNFQQALVGRLNARFELKPHLVSDGINKVVGERILKKRPSEEGELKKLYKAHEGHLALLGDVKSARRLDELTERAFVDAYPFLPHQIRLAQDIFEKLAGFRISGGVRSMISVVMGAVQDLADHEVGVLVSFDQLFDAVRDDLLSPDYLGSAGVLSIDDADGRVKAMPVQASRVLKTLWLLQQVSWVPRVPETLARLLVRNVDMEVPPLREAVEQTLGALQEAGYVARDEATGEWKFLNERERTIEQAIQEMVRPGGPRSISVAAVRRTAQQMCKDDVVTRKRLGNFTVLHGGTKVAFGYGVQLDGESVLSGPDLEVHFTSPLAPGRKTEIAEFRQLNQAGGAKGRTVWWVADSPETLEARLKRYEALVKVTGDKRFTEDTAKATQDALSEKRKERDELRGALVRDLERAFLSGTLLYGGQEIELEGDTDLKAPIQTALTSVIPNVYPSFAVADRALDFPRQLKALLNPATTDLHKVAPDLDLFDTQGSLQRESALVSQVLEVIADLEDEDMDPSGARLIDAGDEKHFKGFARPPFGWPEELVRLVLAASLRAGAIYLERQGSAGTAPIYDFKGTDETFTKVTVFKKATFRNGGVGPTIEQIKRASKALISLGVTGTPESANAIAAAVKSLGLTLKSGIAAARVRAQQGLPIAPDVLDAEPALTEPTTAKDPTKVVTAFLKGEETWKALSQGLDALQAFLDDNRHQAFSSSRSLVALAEHHPLAEGSVLRDAFDQADKDMDALIAAKEVISRWSDYRSAYDAAFAAYRDAYATAWEQVRSATSAAAAELRASAAYAEAPHPERDAVIAKVFGPRKVCHYPPASFASVTALLDAVGRRSLTALDQALVALPAYQAQVEAELRGLTALPPPPDHPVYEWRPLSMLVGKQFTSEEQVDEALAAIGDQLKTRIRDGYTVVVK